MWDHILGFIGAVCIFTSLVGILFITYGFGH